MTDSSEDYSQYGVTRALFDAWRSPRLGDHNPTRMTNPVWEWLIRTQHTGFIATEMIGGPSPFDAGPCWSFHRYGQTCTTLADGHRIYIAGEHEDFYDPDFCIYNDVVVDAPDGTIEIYGYPRYIFPPTDFHSATLVGSQIILIGNLGYQAERKPGVTQVLSLDLDSLAVTPWITSGDMPGWIHGHQSFLEGEGRSIRVTGGKIVRQRGKRFRNNRYDWRLWVNDGVWEQIEHGG
jgi:hypothetical protein